MINIIVKPIGSAHTTYYVYVTLRKNVKQIVLMTF